jgi:hypothetical protein
MAETISVPFKKRLYGSTQKAQTLYWLRCSYGRSFDDAIADAVRIVHSATALAASPETWDKVKTEVVHARVFFEAMMSLASGAPGTEKPIPNRLTVQFKKAFALDSERGRTLQWLIYTYGGKAVDEILYAVWLVYYPAALASSPKTIAQARLQVERSRLEFELKTTFALSQSSPDTMTLIANRLDKTFRASPTEDPLKDIPFATAPEAPDAKVPETDDVVNDSEDDDDGLDIENEVL